MTSRKRVLFIAADLPWPPDGGGRIATLRVLEAFAEECEVDLLALADPETSVDLSRLHELCSRVEVVSHPFTFGRHRLRQTRTALASVLGREPYRLRKFRSRQLATTASRLKRLEAYDLIHYDQFGVATYLDPTYPSTHTTQNIESRIYRRGVSEAGSAVRRTWARLESRKLWASERRLYPAFDTVFALTQEDADDLADVGVRAMVLPMPVDIPPRGPAWPPQERTLLTLGSMSWFGVEEGLLWFAERVFPLIRREVPDVVWTLVGPNAGPRVRDLHDGRSIIVRGYVTDVAPVMEATRVAIIPLQIAGGVRIKLVELMARGTPSVATTIGAQGLSFDDGAGCYRRDSPDAFAAAVVGLLRDDDRWLQVSELGRAYVAANHSRAATREVVSAGIDHALARHAPAGGRHAG